MKYIYAKNLKLETKNSMDVFALFSALNALGYDDENNTKGMTPARKNVRNVLLGYNWNKKYSQLKKAIKTRHQWHLLNAILTKSKNTKKTSASGGFISSLKKFSNEALMRKLWGDFSVYQIKEMKKLLPLFKKETTRLITFINQPPKKIKKVVLIVNLLDAYWRGYSLTTDKTAYVIVGPGAEKNHGELIRHELLHILTLPLQIPPRFISKNERARFASLGYGDRNVLMREYTVRALELLYESEILKKHITRAVKKEQTYFPYIREVMKLAKKRYL